MTVLTPSTRLRLQGILNRIAADQSVTLAEGIYAPGGEDLGDWFGGAPGWLRRS